MSEFPKIGLAFRFLAGLAMRIFSSLGGYSLLFLMSLLLAAPACAQTRFELSRWATVAPASGWSVASVDADIEARTDVVAYYQDNRTLWNCFNKTGTFACSLRATLPTNLIYLRLLSTSFEQSALSYVNGVGVLSGGSVQSFECNTLGSGAANPCRVAASAFPPSSLNEIKTMPIVNVNYDLNGLPETVYFKPGSGQLRSLFWGLVSDIFLASLSPADGWNFLADDFDIDGKPDIMGYHTSTGTLRLCRNIGPAPLGSGAYWKFSCTRTYTATGPAGFSLSGMTQLISGRFFRGYTTPGIMAYRSSDGALFVGRRSGTSYVFSLWSNVSPTSGWVWNTGYFSGRTLPQEILGYQPSDGGLWVGTPK